MYKKNVLRIVSGVFLAVAAINPSAAFAEDDQVLVFSFFRDNGQDGVFLASSEDGVHFAPLNHDRPVMKPANWPDQNLTRDPSMIYRDGLFRAVWTSNWTGNCCGYSESIDLTHWSEPVKVEPFSHVTDPKDKPKVIGAPEITWDPMQKNYIIAFTSLSEREEQNKARGITGDKGNNGACLYLTRTEDGRHFEPAKEFFKENFSSIDGHLTFLPDGKSELSQGRWVMMLKDEREEGGKNIRMTSTNADFSRPWALVSPPIVGIGSSVRGNEMVEGPSLIQWQGKWILYCDAFADGHYCVAVSDDLKTWTDRTPELSMPSGPRHGTIFLAPRAVVEKLK